MAGSGAIRAGRAFVELFADDKSLGAGLKAAGAKVKGWALGLTSQVVSVTKSVAGGISGLLADAGRTGFDLLTGDTENLVGRLTGAAGGFEKMSGQVRSALSVLSQLNGAVKVNQERLAIATEFLKIFADTCDFAKESFQGVADAIASGDIALALEIAVESIKVAWQATMVYLLEKWGHFVGEFQHFALDAFYGVLEISNNVFASMEQGWEDFINWFVDKWKGAQTLIAEGVLSIMGAFDDSLDVADAKGNLHEDADRAAKQRQKAHEDKKKQIEKDRQDREDDLAQQNIDANAGVDAGRSADLEARREALKKAREARAAAIAKTKKTPTGAPIDLAAADLTKISTSGTFSAAAARGLGGGPLDNIALNTAQSAKYLKQLANRATPTIGFT